MLIAIQVLNNITTHRLLTSYCWVLLDYYYYQNTNNFEKILEQKDTENTLKMAIPICLTIGMYIGLTRLLEVGLLNIDYNLKKRLREKYTGINWDNERKIEEAIAASNNKDDDDEDPRDKIR